MIYENKTARVWVEKKIKVGDVVVIVQDVVPRHRWRLGVVVELIQSNDGLVRGVKVKVGKTRNVIRLPVNCLYPNGVCAAEQLDYNIGNVRTTKKKTLVIIIRLKLRVQKEML